MHHSDYDKLGIRLLNEINTDGLTPSELFEKIAAFYSDNEEHAKRLSGYFEKKWFCCSTPVIANLPQNGKKYRGAPISCFLLEIDGNNVDKNLVETIFLAKVGGGIGIDFSDFPSLYDKGDNDRNSFGVLPFIQLHGKATRLNAGFARKVGSMAAYLSVYHADILNFVRMRKNTQGIDPEFMIPRYIHHAVSVSDDFMNAVINDQDWFLYNKYGNIVNKVRARELWMEILTIRAETGEPYILFEDNVNRQLSEQHKRLGLRVKTSNLCTEITLPTGIDHLGRHRSAICCLSSVNLAMYDDWKHDKSFISDIARFMDNVLTYFIVEGSVKKVGDDVNYEEKFGLANRLRPLEKQHVEDAYMYNHPAAGTFYSAYRSRDIGVGAAGWHTLLQKKGIPFASEDANKLNREIFTYIRTEFDNASRKLADERESCPDAADCGIRERFSYKLAIAPTSQISSIMGVSKCIEAEDPVFLSKNQVGFHLIKNPILKQYLDSQGLDHHDIWMKIASQGLDTIVSKEINEIFKGPYEINPLVSMRQVAERPIDQSQSFNLFMSSPVDLSSMIKVHMEAWKNGVKTMYYHRSTEKIKAFDSIIKKLEEEQQPECVACQ
jgi:ribonucleoside-diphosphate reductase alpha chain